MMVTIMSVFGVCWLPYQVAILYNEHRADSHLGVSIIYHSVRSLFIGDNVVHVEEVTIASLYWDIHCLQRFMGVYRIQILEQILHETSSSAVAKKPRDASCLSV